MTTPVADQGRQRRGPVRRWVARAGAAVVVLATLVAGEAIIRTEPTRDDTAESFYTKGEPNQPITVGGLRVTLLGVRGAVTITPPDGPATDTAGVWVIVRVRLESLRNTTTAEYLALADAGGREFRVSERFHQPFAENRQVLQPGLPVEGEVAFEVPRDAATNLTLRIAETFDSIHGGDLDGFTDIRVPATEADVARWLSDPAPAGLSEPAMVS